jgi:SPP1 gp7 family putative phage head morphogenesis protein
MKFAFVNNIFRFLSSNTVKGYKTGLASIVKLNKKNFAERFDSKSSALFSIDYTTKDLQALRHFKVECFTVAHVGSYELQEKLKKLAVDVWQIKQQDFDSFEPEARRIMLDYVPIEDQPPGGWLKTNLNTGIANAYTAAQWIRINDPAITDLYPALRYVTRNDGQVRPEHERLNGKVFLKSDPIWNIIMPQNDWGCRCGATPVPVDNMSKYKVEPVKRDAETQDKYTNWVNPDFKRNPGISMSIWGKWLNSKFKDLPQNVLTQIKKNVKEYAASIWD